MLAKSYAKRLKAGNGYRTFSVLLHVVLWLAFTALLGVYLAERVAALEVALLSPVYDIFATLLPFEASLEIVMLAVFAVWCLLLAVLVRLGATRYIICQTNAGLALYAAKTAQSFAPAALTVSVDGEEKEALAWFTDVDMQKPARAKMRVRGKSITLFATVELPVQEEPAPAVAEEAPVEEAPAEVEEPLAEVEEVIPEETVEEVAAVQEPEILVIIREAEEREAAAPVQEEPAPAVAEEAPVAEEEAPAVEEVAEEEVPAEEEAPAAPVAGAPVAEDAAEDSEDEEEEEAAEIREVTVDGKTFRMVIRYSRSFTARVIQAPDMLKNYYSEIKNELMAYASVKSRISWKHDAFNRGRLQLAKLVVRGKSLCIYLALDPNAYEVEKYHHVDQGNKNAYAKVPMMIRVKSDLGLRKAKFLISEMMANFEIERGETEDLDYASWYAYKDTKTLVEENLIKELELPEEE